MSDKLPNPSIDEIAKFLVPLIDIMRCDRVSLTNLIRNHEKILSKLNQTGRPVLLTAKGQTVLLCDANAFFELENRRRGIVSQIESIEEAIQIVRLDFADPLVVELAEVQNRIACL